VTPLNFAFKRRRRTRRDVDEAFCGKIAGARNFLLAKLRCKRARHCGNADEMRVFVAFCTEFFLVAHDAATHCASHDRASIERKHNTIYPAKKIMHTPPLRAH